MHLHKYYATIFVLCCMQLAGINAYPTLNIRRLFDSAVENRYKKSDIVLPQVDEDVLELEHLKREDDAELMDDILQPKTQQHHQQPFEKLHEPTDAEMPIAVAETKSINHSDTLPELERQLESATASAAVPVTPVKPLVEVGSGQAEHEQTDGIQGAHRPPMLPHNDGGKSPNNNQQSSDSVTGAEAISGVVPSMAKPFYGAARLAFGQNPEVLPTSSTTSTSTVAMITTTTAANSLPIKNNDAAEPTQRILLDANVQQVQNVDATTTPEVITTILHPAIHPLRSSHPEKPKAPEIESAQEQHKETVSDVMVDELDVIKSAARRSVPHLMPPKTAEKLMKLNDGQYSSFDMAQYVFWTGDEVGVARAVEEFIEQGLMTRENALKFLRDIRLGIEYLQRSYSNRVFPEEIRENNVKKSYPPATTTTSTTSTTTTTTTEKPFPSVHLENADDLRNDDQWQRAVHSIAIWNKLEELNNDGRQEITEYDETAGRAKIAEFLYTEYTLEEILYNLAKVMFTQSLAHGSGEAQHELQKLTDFLEREGNRGVIPLDLQKKVLHVLLTALSDTLSERPELLPAARINLGSSLNSLPMRSYRVFN